jgi:hypothetical protein
MNLDFKQVYTSKVLEQYFGYNFRTKWKLSEYLDTNQPAIFLGLYEHEDVCKLIEHKGPKILIWGGGDMESPKLQFISSLQKEQEIHIWAYPGEFSNTLTNYSIQHKPLYIPLKDYSNFKLTPLGEKIYIYKGIHGDRSDYFKWNEIINPLTEVFGRDSILYADHLPIDDLVQNIYKNCFVYIKPNPKGGCTTMFELGHMGIRTLGKNHKNLDIFTEYDSTQDLIRLVKEESKYIGQIREDVSNSARKAFTGEEWLSLNFWRK